MAMNWNYQNYATLKIDNAVDSDNYLVVSDSQTATSNKTLSFKGFKVPADNEDANDNNSAYKLFVDVILDGIFGLGQGLNLTSGQVQIEADITGDPE